MKLFAIWPYWELNSTLFRPSPSLTKVPSLITNLGFFFPVLSPGWKVFSTIISSFSFPSIFPHQVLEVFHQLIFLSDFLFQSLITGLKGFSIAIWFFETHQLFYGARMFSLVFRLSSSVSLIGFGSFLPSSNSRFFPNRQVPRSAKLTSKKKGNCNIMVTKPTNYMISICNHSYNLLTWSWHKLHLDIKSSLIPISVSSFLCYDYIQVSYLSRLH